MCIRDRSYHARAPYSLVAPDFSQERSFMSHSRVCLLIAVFTFAPARLLAQNFDGVHMLMGAGGNIGVSSGEDGVIIVDDEYAPLTGKIKAAVGAITPKPIR